MRVVRASQRHGTGRAESAVGRSGCCTLLLHHLRASELVQRQRFGWDFVGPRLVRDMTGVMLQGVLSAIIGCSRCLEGFRNTPYPPGTLPGCLLTATASATIPHWDSPPDPREDGWMQNFLAYFVAAGTLAGCVTLPLMIFTIATGGRTLREIVRDRKVRDAVRDALRPVMLAQVTFTSIATLAGAAGASAWWLVRASHINANPIIYAIGGAGIGLIISVNISLPALGPRAVISILPSTSSEILTSLREVIDGSEKRIVRWPILFTFYVYWLDAYGLVVFFVAWLFDARPPRGSHGLQHLHLLFQGLLLWLMIAVLCFVLTFTIGAVRKVRSRRAASRDE
jgi:hypothetical protein